jgi:hypothetical protein
MFCNHRKARPAKDDAPLFDSGRWEMVPKADLIGEGKRTSRIATNVKIMQRPSETSHRNHPAECLSHRQNCKSVMASWLTACVKRM